MMSVRWLMGPDKVLHAFDATIPRPVSVCTAVKVSQASMASSAPARRCESCSTVIRLNTLAVSDVERGYAIREALSEENPEALFCDGLEAALVGVARRKGSPSLPAYSVKRILDIYMNDGATLDEAREYFEFNVVDAWVGEGTPVFLEDDLWNQ